MDLKSWLQVFAKPILQKLQVSFVDLSNLNMTKTVCAELITQRKKSYCIAHSMSHLCGYIRRQVEGAAHLLYQTISRGGTRRWNGWCSSSITANETTGCTAQDTSVY